MKIVSFDVGIKNLAFCIFDISNTMISILKWDVLNLITNVISESSGEIEYKTNKCNCKLISKKRGEPEKFCGNNAKYFMHNNYYCDKHAKKQNDFLIPTKECSQISLKKRKLEELQTIATKYNIPISEHKLKKDILNCIVLFFENKCLKNISKEKIISAGEIDLITIGKNMKIILDNIKLLDSIDSVIIENQISPIANRMKTIQGMLAQYFIMKNSNIDIQFISSSNKLKIGKPTTPSITSRINEGEFLGETENTLQSSTSQTTCSLNYKKNKQDGIFHCSQILEKNNCFKEYKYVLQNKKKSDDLADCFLQGIWYLQNKKYILLENYIMCGQLKNK